MRKHYYQVLEGILHREGFTKIEFEKPIARVLSRSGIPLTCDVYAEKDGQKIIAEVKLIKNSYAHAICEGVGQLLFYKHLIPDASMFLILIGKNLKNITESKTVQSFLSKYGIKMITLEQPYKVGEQVRIKPSDWWMRKYFKEGEVRGYETDGKIIVKVSQTPFIFTFKPNEVSPKMIFRASRARNAYKE